MPIPQTLEVREGERLIGSKEIKAFSLTVTPRCNGAAPANPSNNLYDITDPDNWVNVSATLLSGSASFNGDVFTSQQVSGVTIGHVYRLEFIYVCGGNTLENFVPLRCVA